MENYTVVFLYFLGYNDGDENVNDRKQVTRERPGNGKTARSEEKR